MENSMKHKYYLTILILIFLPNLSFAITIGEIINPLDKYLNCEQANPIEKKVCIVVQNKVNQILSSSSISFNHGDVLYKYSDGTNRKINTGHSCTYTAKMTSITANTNLNSGGSVDFKGNSISKPVIFTIRLPINLYTRTNIKAKLGARFFGKCIRLGTDSFYADANLATTANLGILFSLEPKLERAPNGDYVISIQPIINVSSEVTNTSVNLNFHRVSPLTTVYIAVVGTTSSLFKSFKGVLHGDSVKDIFDTAIIDIGTGIVLTNSIFPIPLVDSYIDREVRNAANDRITGASNRFSDSLGMRLTQKMNNALNLDSSGRRVFVVGTNLIIKPTPASPAIPSLTVIQFCLRNKSTAIIRWSAVSGSGISYKVQKRVGSLFNTIYNGPLLNIRRLHTRSSSYRVQSCTVYGCSNFSPLASAQFTEKCGGIIRNIRNLIP